MTGCIAAQSRDAQVGGSCRLRWIMRRKSPSLATSTMRPLTMRARARASSGTTETFWSERTVRTASSRSELHFRGRSAPAISDRIRGRSDPGAVDRLGYQAQGARWATLVRLAALDYAERLAQLNPDDPACGPPSMSFVVITRPGPLTHSENWPTCGQNRAASLESTDTTASATT